ncbi:MAG: glycosyltransferase family 2 protein [Bacteroidales bacterium]
MEKINNTLFSIITVCYNAEATIKSTLESIKGESFRNFEYIIVDGGSTDATLKIIRNSGVITDKLISESDSGIYDAMNKGIANATGEYLIFLNAGDTFYRNDTLYSIANIIGSERPDVIYGDTAIVDINGNFKSLRRLRPPKTLSARNFRHGMTVCHQSFIAKREIAPLYSLSYHFSADFDWCIRILKSSTNCFNTRLILINYLDEGITSRNRKASLIERFRIMCRHYGTESTVIFHIWFLIRGIFK